MFSWLRLPFGGSNDDARTAEAAGATCAASSSCARTPNSIRICTFNTYLIPSAMVNKDNATCTDQSKRAGRIGRWIRSNQIDIALLQEVWGGGQPTLEAALHHRDDGDDDDARGARSAVVGPEDSKYEVIGWCGSWGVAAMDAVWQFTTGRGGLWVSHRAGPSSPVLLENGPVAVRWHRYSKSKTRSRKGAVAVRYHVRTKSGKPSNLIVVNTHVDPMNTDGIIEFQFAELLTFLSDSVLGSAGLLGDGEASVPPLEGSEGGLDCAVVICGDLNTDPTSALGRKLATLAAGSEHNTPLRDLYAEHVGTFGSCVPTYDSKMNSLVMWNDQSRLDWVFGVDRVGGVRMRRTSALNVVVDRSEAKEPMSDHWPVVADIQLED